MSLDPVMILVLPVVVLSIVVHECAHAWAAWKLGDPTARNLGRVTLNPLPHLDLMGSILVPAVLLLLHSPVLFGWAKPVPVVWANLRRPRPDQLKVAMAGPASNLLLALGFAALARLAPSEGFFAPLGAMALAGVTWNCALALFNLIPIPPLDGSWLLMYFLPLRHIIALQRFRMVAMVLLLVLMSSPVVSNLLLAVPLRLAIHACLGLFGVTPEGLPI